MRHRGCDHVELFAPEQTILACVRVERRHCNPRFFDAGATHGHLSECQRLFDALHAQLLERNFERDVRGHARHPQPVEHVHLTEESAMAREMREELVLVVEAPTTGVQGGLVERREGDAFNTPCHREINHVSERFTGDATRGLRDLASPHACGIEIGEIKHGYLIARPVDGLGRRITSPVQLDVCVARAQFEHSRIAYDQQSRDIVQTTIGEDARALLGADAGAVAEHQPHQRNR